MTGLKKNFGLVAFAACRRGGVSGASAVTANCGHSSKLRTLARLSKELGVAALLMLACHASAATIRYDDFSNLTGLTLGGDAAQSGTALRLTNADAEVGAGVFFYSTPVNLGSTPAFSTYFQFRLSNNLWGGDEDGPGADGFTFIVQRDLNTEAVGGGGMGYQSFPNSAAVEFDTFENGPPDDPDGNHVGIDTQGSMASIATASEAIRFNEGQIWHAWVDYNGVTQQMEVRWSLSSVRPTDAGLSATVDLASILGSPTAYVGFGGGVGAYTSDQDILSWEFRDQFDPIEAQTPEPCTFALMGAGLAALAYSKRSRTTRPCTSVRRKSRPA